MTILLLGGGGREHALAWKLAQSPQVERVVALPGSDAIAAVATCIPGDPCDPAAVVAAARAHAAGLVVVGPEAPLAAGVADALQAAGIPVFGPTRAAAQLESSKAFAKEFMARHGIPTAGFEAVDTPAAGRRALAGFGAPVVLKADGLAAGKGVVITSDRFGALHVLDAMLAGEMVGAAGRRVVIEEYLEGPEVSLLAVCDGERYRLLPAARDHKRVRNGNRGPNTGGMGAVSHNRLLKPAETRAVEDQVIVPTLRGMAAAGHPFQGVLYCGLMLTRQGPRVLEFNARFGDPETQAILPRWNGDLAALLLAAARGDVAAAPAPAAPAPDSACVVAAAKGYPAAPVTGDAITGLDSVPPGVLVFHAGTRRDGNAWTTAGGRVLAVASTGNTLKTAVNSCYAALDHIDFPGMHARRDIGKRR